MRNFANHPRLFIARSTIHGLGLFAGEDIEWGQRVIEYQGEPLSTREVKRRQRFYDSIGFTCLMQFGDGLGVDAISGGNESRFINHSRRPNLGAIREDKWRIVFYSLDDISQGDELTFNYGFGSGEFAETPKTLARLETGEASLRARNIGVLDAFTVAKQP